MRRFLFCILVALPACGTPRSNTEMAAEYAREARNLVDDGDTTEAIEKYRCALEYQSAWTKVRFDLARLTFEKGKEHFLNHLAWESQATEARTNGDLETMLDRQKISTRERGIGVPLLEEAGTHFRIVIGSGTPDRDYLLNGYLYLGHIHAFLEQYQAARDSYFRARKMDPPPTAMNVIDDAIALMDRELDREAERDIGPPPQ